MSHLFDSCSHTANQCCGSSLFLLVHFQRRKLHYGLRISLGFYLDHAVLSRGNHSDDIQVDRGCQYLAVLMICVVAAHFASSRCAVDLCFLLAVQLLVALQRLDITFCLIFQNIFIQINVHQQILMYSVSELFL